MEAKSNYLALCCGEQWKNGLFYHIEPLDDRLWLDCTRYSFGAFCLTLDSGENSFSWSRVAVDVRLPPDSALRVYAHASDQPVWGGWGSLEERFAQQSGDPTKVLRDVFGQPVASDADFYLGCCGRYLWLALELDAAGEESPIIQRISLRIHSRSCGSLRGADSPPLSRAVW